MSDKELIQICIEEISHKLGYADPKSLRQRDLEHVCREIEKRTDILISLSTVKRLLNGQFNRLPQIATLNAITTYLGYESWQDFKAKKKGQIGVTTESIIKENTPVVPRAKVRRWVSYKLIVLSIAVILCITLISLSYFKKAERVNETDISFSAKKVTSNDMPNTVIFHYDVSKVNGDSFFIQQSWDKDRRVKVDPKGNTLTDIYYEPGYHTAKLMVNAKVVKTIDVHIPTDGWFFYSKPNMFQGLPTHIRSENPVHEGILSLSRADIQASKPDSVHDNYYFYTFFPGEMKVPSDNFSFKTRIRWKELWNVSCPKIMHEIFGQSNSLFFFTTPTGCTGEMAAQFGEHFLDGKTNDLSPFGGNIREWQEIEVIVKNKEARILINQKLIYTKTYTTSFGLLTGLAFISNGICEIDTIDLRGLDGRIVYSNNFDN